MPKNRRIANLGPLHDLMLKACVPNAEGFQSIALLAGQVECTPAALYSIIKKGKITPTMAVSIVNAAKGTPHEGVVSLEDFHPYVYC